MRPCLPPVRVIFLSIAGILLCVFHAHAQGPYSISGYAWGTPVENVDGLSFKSATPPFVFFVRPKDPFMRETPPASEVVYMFLNGKLAGASLWFGTQDDYQVWAERFSKLYGPAMPPSDDQGLSLVWGQGDVTIVGSFVQKLEAGVFNYTYLPLVREYMAQKNKIP